ncbi:TniQ family protein [Pelomonas parva]|uniref:TniQ family protein n=1 Tax=Pelomonas parva TaxID=3299032 RepID=A0ABW7FB70_9BURK
MRFYAPQALQPFEGEALVSVVGRWLRISGAESPASLIAALLGNQHRTISLSLPGRWQHLLAEFPPVGHYLVDDAVDQFTSAPLFRPFMEPDDWPGVRNSLLMEDSRRARMKLGLVRGGGEPVELAHCVDCIQSQVLKYGAPYWLARHSLPHVAACHVHGRLLQVAPPASNLGLGKHRYLGFPNPDAYSEAGNLGLEAACRLAELLTDIHQARLQPLGNATLAAAYLYQLRQLGLVESGGRVRKAMLWTLIQSAWSGLAALESERRTGRPGWLSSIYSDGVIRVRSPLQHAITIGALFGSVSAWRDVLDRGAWAFEMPATETRRALVGSRAAMLNYWMAERSYHQCSVIVPPSVSSLLLSGLSVREVSSQTGHSVRGIYKILGGNEALAKEWSAAAVLREGQTREALIPIPTTSPAWRRRGQPGLKRDKKWLFRHRHTLSALAGLEQQGAGRTGRKSILLNAGSVAAECIDISEAAPLCMALRWPPPPLRFQAVQVTTRCASVRDWICAVAEEVESALWSRCDMRASKGVRGAAFSLNIR